MGCYVYWNGKADWGVKDGYAINLIAFEGGLQDRSFKVPSLGVTLHR